jgi:hypothetical protein
MSETLEKLETSLWLKENRFDHNYMDKLLHPDFFEFGRSGKIYSRQQCLSAEPQEIKINLPLKNFNILPISKNVFQVTYISEVMYNELEIAHRSSIWVKTDQGWKLRFHQGTPAN